MNRDLRTGLSPYRARATPWHLPHETTVTGRTLQKLRQPVPWPRCSRIQNGLIGVRDAPAVTALPAAQL